MLRVRQNKEEIIIRELPIIRWISFLGLAVVLFLPVFVFFPSHKDSFDLFWSIGMSIGVIVCLIFALTNPITTTKINKPGQTVSVRKQSLIKYKFDVYSFNEIADLIYVNVKEGGRGGTTYQLLMPLENGKKIEISTTDGSKSSQYFDAAYLMNPYIFDTSKQIPFKLTVFNDD
jgi:hypothetical protein